MESWDYLVAPVNFSGVILYAIPKCDPCKLVKQALKADRFRNLPTRSVLLVPSIEAHGQYAIQMGLKYFPTLVFYRLGKEVARRIIGLPPGLDGDVERISIYVEFVVKRITSEVLIWPADRGQETK